MTQSSDSEQRLPEGNAVSKADCSGDSQKQFLVIVNNEYPKKQGNPLSLLAMGAAFCTNPKDALTYKRNWYDLAKMITDSANSQYHRPTYRLLVSTKYKQQPY